MDPRVLGTLLCDEQITVETDQPHIFNYQTHPAVRPNTLLYNIRNSTIVNSFRTAVFRKPRIRARRNARHQRACSIALVQSSIVAYPMRSADVHRQDTTPIT